ncbi:MAG: phenylalanine--tRNA ligase subunit alpha [Deltaproteobacteria bacterium]|nr:phenylalanine--tRNA ligase subunit alpha [Deltaproteobacteria bacterium]
MLTTDSVNELRRHAKTRIAAVSDKSTLDEARASFLGKKGEITVLMKQLASIEPTARKELGALLNSARDELERLFLERANEFAQAALDRQLQSEWIDVSLPVKAIIPTKEQGSIHPLTKVQRELEAIFVGLGFSVVDGPEVELDYYNFEALNIPETHPARDMQDSFYTTCGKLLRCHTSSIQVRALERLKPPLRIVAPGRCFRCERVDSSHEHTFYQMEGMMIDREVNVGHLIYFMRTLLREIFGNEQKVRLRPGYFPFVEPGFELDIWFRGRWLELLPCGLIHPKVLEYGGLDPELWSGFAFGLGLSRLVMSRYGIDDIRYLQSGDLRFLKQF